MADSDPDFEPESTLTRQEMLAQVAWPIGIIGSLFLGLKVATSLFPDGEPLLLLASVAIPEAAILYGIALWRRRTNA
jgi:hypothetical protein